VLKYNKSLNYIMAITVSKEFITAFNFCMEKYGVIGEELEFEKNG